MTPARNTIRTLQIIVAAMTAGCLLFLAIVFVVVETRNQPSDRLVITGVMAIVAAMLVLMRVVVPGAFVAQTRRRMLQEAKESSTAPIDPAVWSNRLAQAFMTRTILSVAIIEAAVFPLLIAYLIEQSPVSLVLAAMLIVCLAGHFPTAQRMAAWIEHQTRLLDEERSF